MKVFLLGIHWGNGGPNNVNKALIAHANSSLLYTKSSLKWIRYLETVYYIWKCDRVLLSGLTSMKVMMIIKFFRKQFYYLMHGCAAYETVINKLNLSDRTLTAEQQMLEKAIKIICVSEGYAEWVKQRYPQYKDKITFVNNGIALKQRPKVAKEPFSIAVAGGNRCIKNNGEVYRAVQKLKAEGIPCKLYVFGRIYPDNDDFINNDDVIYFGHLNKKEYYEKLEKIACFIMNSEVEPFGLVVADALNCNCSLLMSQYVGSRYIMKTQENDIIQNPHNIQELSEKIKYVLNHPNSDRLFQTIDVEACSEKQAYENIKKIVEA